MIDEERHAKVRSIRWREIRKRHEIVDKGEYNILNPLILFSYYLSLLLSFLLVKKENKDEKIRREIKRRK